MSSPPEPDNVTLFSVWIRPPASSVPVAPVPAVTSTVPVWANVMSPRVTFVAALTTKLAIAAPSTVVVTPPRFTKLPVDVMVLVPAPLNVIWATLIALIPEPAVMSKSGPISMVVPISARKILFTDVMLASRSKVPAAAISTVLPVMSPSKLKNASLLFRARTKTWPPAVRIPVPLPAAVASKVSPPLASVSNWTAIPPDPPASSMTSSRKTLPVALILNEASATASPTLVRETSPAVAVNMFSPVPARLMPSTPPAKFAVIAEAERSTSPARLTTSASENVSVPVVVKLALTLNRSSEVPPD